MIYQFMTDRRAMNCVIMAMYVFCMFWWLAHGSWRDALYWLCAFGITATVTWGFER